MKIINFGKKIFLKLIIIFLINFIVKNYAFAQQISPEIKENFSNPSIIGNYNLKVWGFKVYNIQLVTETKNFSYQNKLALVINYQRNFTKKDLIKRSLEEISRINNIEDGSLLKSYENKLEEIFFDVKEGDRKTAFFDPKNGVKLYFNGKFVGEINDLIFAKRFVDIWLSEKSSFPKMTKAILGKNE